jgi:hypothetical protein
MDIDHDGFIDQEDFDGLATRWVKLRVWRPGSPEYQAMWGVMTGWWHALRATADQNRDDGSPWTRSCLW